MSEQDKRSTDWLYSPDKHYVETAVIADLHHYIQKILKELAEANIFTPEEYAEVVITALNSILSDPQERENMIRWIRESQLRSQSRE